MTNCSKLRIEVLAAKYHVVRTDKTLMPADRADSHETVRVNTISTLQYNLQVSFEL